MRGSVLVAVLLLITLPPPAAWPAEGAVFEPQPCDHPGTPAQLAARIVCGTVSVPLVYDRPAAGHWQLYVVVLKASDPASSAGTVMHHPGGPGVAASAVYPSYFQAMEGASVLGNRDLVMFDDRGTGRSQPGLCMSAGVQVGDLIASDLSMRAFLAAMDDVMLRCRDELTRAGVSPESFGTDMTARDLDQIRQALRVPRWDFLAVSYSTRLAMVYAALFPQAVRTMALNAPIVLPGQPLDTTAGYRASVAGLAGYCAADARCTARHPDVLTSLARTVSRLEAKPLEIAVEPALGLAGNRVILNRGEFEWLLFFSLYRRALYGQLPALIEAAGAQGSPALTAAVELMVGDFRQRIVSLLTYPAVTCSDRIDTSAVDAPMSGPQWMELKGVCSHWSPSAIPLALPRNTAIPTLIISGGNDPIAQPIYARQVASLLGSAAQLVEFPGMGHAVAAEHVCAHAITRAFFDAPSIPLDVDCARIPTPIHFD